VKPIAIYHCSIKIFSRGKGASAVAKSAYRAAEKIHNEYNGITSDYTHKTGVVHTEILLPDHAPIEYQDRAILWNAVEKCERYKTAQLAREIEISLPVELSREQNIILAREYVQKYFVDKGMCADLCIHDPKGDNPNPHAHIMLTMRPIEKDGTWGAKSKSEHILDDNGERIKLSNGNWKSVKVPTVDWNEQTKAEEWRSAWADILNEHLEKHGHAEKVIQSSDGKSVTISNKVDHRSYERQGIDKVPTIHMGVAASQMEKKGIRTDKGNRNREIADINKEIRQTKARIKKVKTWLYAQPIINPPTFLSIMQPVADVKNQQCKWQKIADLKTRAKLLVFLQENNITDMDNFVRKVTKVNEDLLAVSDEIKRADRRIETLATHLEHCENRKLHKTIYDKYKALTPKKDTAAMNSLNPFTKKKAVADYDAAVAKQEAFYDKHSAEIETYKTAQDYLKAVLNGRTEIPTGAWKKEQTDLAKHRYSLGEKFYAIKDEIRMTEVVKKGIDSLLHDVVRDRQHTRTQGVDR